MKKKMISMLLSAGLIMGALTACQNNAAEKKEETTAATKQDVADTTKKDTDTTTAEKNNEESETAGEFDEVVTIEFFQQKSEEGPQKGYQEVINLFHEKYPNITIEMNTVPDAGKVLTSRVASGDIPPIFSDYPTQMQFKQKVENGFVEKLTGQDFLDRVAPASLEMSKANDDEYYALPLSGVFMGMFYNIDIFEENDLQVPETYAELIELCQTLESKDIAPLGLTFKDPGRVGHMFQAMSAAWLPSGPEIFLKTSLGETKIVDDSDIPIFAEKMKELVSYANDDAFGIADTAMWENFANGKYAMTITGSYASGTIRIANPDINLGAFPIPNDTKEMTNILTGIDAAVCISGHASDVEKDAGIKFLEFLSQTDNAQIWCDNDGAPSLIKDVIYKDTGVKPAVDMIASGHIFDWMASTIEGNVITEMYNVTQGFLLEQNVEQYIKELDSAIEIAAQS